MKEEAASVRSFVNEMELINTALIVHGKNPMNESLYMRTLQNKTPTRIWDRWTLECQLFTKEIFASAPFLEFLKKFTKSLETQVGCSNGPGSCRMEKAKRRIGENKSKFGWSNNKPNGKGKFQQRETIEDYALPFP